MAQRVTTMTNYTTLEYIDKVEAEQLAAIDRLLEFLPSYIRDYSEYKKSKVATKTRREYIQDFFSFFSFLIDTKEECKDMIIKDVPLEVLSSVTLDEFAHYESWLKDEDKGGGSNTAITIKRKKSSLRSLYNYLYASDRISVNPVVKIETTRTKKKKRENIRVLDDKERAVFLKRFEQQYEKAVEKLNEALALEDTKGKKVSEAIRMKPALVKRDKAIVYLALGSGLRVSELCAINCADFVPALGRINVIRKGERDGNEADKRTDFVLLNKEVVDILIEYMNEYRDTIGPDINNYDALFLSSKHTRITPRAIEQMVREYADATLGANNGVVVHSLRASFGQRFQDTFGNILATADVLNHSDISVTASHYLKKRDTAKQDAQTMPVG